MAEITWNGPATKILDVRLLDTTLMEVYVQQFVNHRNDSNQDQVANIAVCPHGFLDQDNSSVESMSAVGIFGDNEGVMDLAKGHDHPRINHVKVHCHSVKEHVASGSTRQ